MASGVIRLRQKKVESKAKYKGGSCSVDSVKNSRLCARSDGNGVHEIFLLGNRY